MSPQSEVPGRLARGARLLVAGPSGDLQLEVASSRDHGDGVLLSFVGREGRDAVDSLRGATLEVEVDSIPPAPEGRFWIHQLIGCRCEDEVLGPLGVVADVLEDGGGDLLEVVEGNRELLIPFVAALVPDVDIVARLVRTRLPEGFLEACGSAS